MQRTENSAIVCCRVVSMLMIVLCHIVNQYTFIPGHAVLDQILNVGVYTFFAMSGYLYGSRTIFAYGSWLRKRCGAVVFPAWVLACCVILAEFLSGQRHSFFDVAVYLLGAQGIGFVFFGFYRYFTEIRVLGPLWFTTVIMLCYCMVPLLQRCRNQLSKRQTFFMTVTVATMVCFVLTLKWGIVLFYFLTFAIGYFLSAGKYCLSMGRGAMLGATVLTFAAQMMRFVLQSLYDGSPGYQTYTYLSHMILGTWIMIFFLWIQQIFPDWMERLAGHRCITTANGLSMYIYLTHYCFCRGSLDLYRIFTHPLSASLAFAAATLLSSVILKKLVEGLRSGLKISH